MFKRKHLSFWLAAIFLTVTCALFLAARVPSVTAQSSSAYQGTILNPPITDLSKMGVELVSSSPNSHNIYTGIYGITQYHSLQGGNAQFVFKKAGNTSHTFVVDFSRNDGAPNPRVGGDGVYIDGATHGDKQPLTLTNLSVLENYLKEYNTKTGANDYEVCLASGASQADNINDLAVDIKGSANGVASLSNGRYEYSGRKDAAVDGVGAHEFYFDNTMGSKMDGGGYTVIFRYRISDKGFMGVTLETARGVVVSNLDISGGCAADNMRELLFGTGDDGDAGGLIDSDESGVLEEENCENIGGLAWLACPVIKMIESGLTALDRAIQSLLTIPSQYFKPIESGAREGQEPLRQVWTSMRNFALLLLIPVMLVMVISTALGFEFVSAYTVKKTLPRFLIAAIFIVLSWHLMVFAVEFINLISRGILGIMTAPIDGYQNSMLSSHFSQTSGLVIFGGALVGGALLVSLGMLAIIGSFAITLLLVLLTGFILLSLREILIVALVVLAPLAILAWIFPANTKLWNLWWGTFSKLLLLFPLVMLLIGSGRLVAGMVSDIYQHNAFLRIMLVLIAYIGPYALIPLTFKFAGGLFANLTGMINDKERGLFDRQKKYRQRTTSQGWERTAGRKIVQKRADWQNRLQGRATGKGISGWAKRKAYGGLAGAVGGYNIQAADSARRAAVGKELNEQIATGRDDEIRGLSVNKQAALQTADGDLWRSTTDGGRQFKTLGGAWVSEGAVDAGHKRWGKDTYAQQAALSYEMRKAATSEQVAGIGERYRDLATGPGGWKMTETQAKGALKGAGFENQNQHLEFKHMKMDGSIDHKAFAEEIYEKKGSYPLAQMSGHTIEQLKSAYDIADSAGDDETKQRIQSVAETFMYRGGAGGQVGTAGPDGEEMPVTDLPRDIDARTGRVPQEIYQTNTPGAAAVAERVRDLAHHVGVYRPDMPPIPKTPSPGPRPSIPPHN